MKIFFGYVRTTFGPTSAERKTVVTLFPEKQCITGMRFRGVEKEDPLFFEKIVLKRGRGSATRRRR
jgi:hypothetical protein